MDDIKEFGITRENEERRDGGCAFVFDPKTQKYAVGKQHDGFLRLFSGGVDENENITEGILREVREESGLYDFEYVEITAQAVAHFRNILKNVNRVGHATCLLVILKTASLQPVQLEEHEKFDLVWVSAEELLSNFHQRNENHDVDHWIYFWGKAVCRAKELGYDTTSTIQ